jgi:tRNA threonylcarbamoyladenosine modification (KEOPS) complex Cgi121 subunit/molybdopterin converting factor small subunit
VKRRTSTDLNRGLISVKVRVKFLAVLRGLAGTSFVDVESSQGLSIRDVIYLACKDNEALFKRVFEPSGERIRSDIIVLVDGVDVNLMGGLDSTANHVNEITLIPSVHGGSVTPATIDKSKNLLGLLMNERGKVDLRVLHIKLKEELPSREVARMLEGIFEGTDAVWAASRPGLALSELHVFLVFYHTIKAFALGKNISNKFNIEFLLRLVCEDQIVRALEVAGIGKSAKEFCLYFMSPSREASEKVLRALSSLPVEEAKQLDFSREHETTSLLEVLRVSDEELHATSYTSSALSPELKSVLTRTSLMNIRR